VTGSEQGVVLKDMFKILDLNFILKSFSKNILRKQYDTRITHSKGALLLTGFKFES
jgi:hypothetical protein